MTQPEDKTSPAPVRGMSLSLDEVGGALVVCMSDGTVEGMSASGGGLLAALGFSPAKLPARMPIELWKGLTDAPHGVATTLTAEGGMRIGCTRYPVGDDHVLLLMQDVSAKQRELARRLQRQRLESMGRLVASIAHDLRSSLTPIVFNTEVLTSRFGELPRSEALELLREIESATTSMRRTMNGILDFAKLGPPVVEDVNLAYVVGRAATLLRALLRRGHASLTTNIPPDAEWVRGNPLVLEQALVNLLVNAVEAGDEVVIRITARVAGDATQRMVELRVEDSGRGIPEHQRAHIFEPFFTTKMHGTGLGLASSRSAIRDLGGDIVLAPSTGGAVFLVTMPMGAPPGGGAGGAS